MAELLLRWEKFGLSRGLHSMLGAGELVDVTLACQGEILQAHKTVLAACSPHFKHIFMVNPSQHPVVIMQDVQLPHLKALLNFMYTGEATVDHQDLSSFLRTAEALMVSGLAASDEQEEPEESETTVSKIPRLDIEPSCSRSSHGSPSLPHKKPRHNVSGAGWTAPPSSLLPPPSFSPSVLAMQALDLPAVKFEFEERLQTEETWPSLNQTPENHNFTAMPDPRGQPVCDNQSRSHGGHFVTDEQHQALKKRHLSTDKEQGPVCNSSRSESEASKESGWQLYNCQFCKKVFSSRDTFCLHMPCAHGSGELSQPTTCDGCKKKFKNKRSLLEHIRVFHSGKNNIFHMCHVCGKSYTNKSNLNLHIRTKHKGEKY